ncbi:hypothetical protein ES319_D07G243900v1 [Gossypium barbadense]|uniref:Uncharacterized protein n=2 Tax=Gossypium TaxID=3633 RepID=A0A5J5QWH8_GOSBA|nr:hypothetical protein ES319_D07G243900v1 [Gossypium barbadense]TYG62810.1 hypothetical protein ES288_D07G261900v1 [Gossypium darwinii]
MLKSEVDLGKHEQSIDYKSCSFLLNYNDIGISATGFFCFFLLISEFLIHCLERVNLFSEGDALGSFKNA